MVAAELYSLVAVGWDIPAFQNLLREARSIESHTDGWGCSCSVRFGKSLEEGLELLLLFQGRVRLKSGQRR